MPLDDVIGLLGGNSDSVVPAQSTPALGKAFDELAAQGHNLPWESAKTKSRFFPSFDIDSSRWDSLFPYRLLVIDTAKQNQIVNGGSEEAFDTDIVTGTGSAIVTYTPLDTRWIFQLPISPEQLKIVDQYAISTSATLRGVIEEHNGVKFKSILASGSFGVWPYRKSITSPTESSASTQSVFGGTFAAVSNLKGSFKKFQDIALGNSDRSKPKSARPQGADLTSTGYYRALALTQFLEQYAEAKKLPQNAGWRLVFDIPKQNQSFIVTPVQFEWSQSAQSTLSISYSMQFKAWRRIKLSQRAPEFRPSITTLNANALQSGLNAITQARAVLSQTINLIKAVRSDVDNVFGILRQIALFVKDLSGVANTLADMPAQLVKDLDSEMLFFLQTVDLASNPNLRDGQSPPKKQIDQITSTFSSAEGLSLRSVAEGQLGSQAAASQAINPSLKALSDPLANFSLFNLANIQNLNLNSAQQAQVNSVVESARRLTVDDFKKYRMVLSDVTLQLSNSFGAGSAFYSKTYGKSAPSSRVQPMTLDEYEILRSLYNVLQFFDILTATTDVNSATVQSSLAYVSGLAADSNILFSTSTSKIQVPVPFRFTIEQIAAKYLQNPQRWLEIVTLNNLKAPYIDENGFKLSLLSNASGRQITVASTANLFIGQRVVISSATQAPTARIILNIDRLSSTSFLLTLDGAPNLDTYHLADKAYLQAYLPGTVNSQQKIYVPSDLAVPNLPQIVLPTSTTSDPLTGISQVDFLLTDSGDLAVNNYGDFRLASGITNLIQAIKLKIGTRKGSVLLHPEYGLGLQPGTVSSDLYVKNVYKIINDLVTSDPRFQGLSGLQVVLNGQTLSINMSVSIANQSGVVPLSFTLT